MRVKTYCVYLPKYDIAFNQDALIDFQKQLDGVVGGNKCRLNINSTPLNKVTSFTVAVWALGRTEDENRTIIEQIEEYLVGKNIAYSEYESYLFFNEEKIYIEMEVNRLCKEV